ncbi:hypothetical protein GPECTOR_107g153 [Gonium pectorale]|uniref:glycerophosphodiester phosphodiesterase n=1 Tax=Gonium pectorale TaxID=33097 RepID=A0A150FZJ6_GONPE|nr:hypothetical protein GPECTOR_107g153 [Gonium pectorale]|eukprot:KXZ43009.1 hypothetical protein GPECTOR_107g153 [Gonium pectorale]
MGKHGPMLLGGHRGMGENLAMLGTDGSLGVYPAFRENTIQSFQEAVKCGVGFVEFDVQVTRDNVPIIWHDDDVVFGPAEQPRRPQVKDLTFAELQTLCGRHTHHHGHHHHGHHHHDRALGPGPGQAGSVRGSSEDGSEATDLGDRSPRTHGGSEDGSCASSGSGAGDAGCPRLLRRFRDRATRQWNSRYEPWRCARDDSIPTLEEVFRSLPPEVGFDIEVKMTTGDDVVHTPAEEVERMLAAILPVVERCATPPAPASTSAPDPAARSRASSPLPLLDFVPSQHHSAAADRSGGGPGPLRRRIMFSSFDPDVCVELKRRQGAHPVYYLSGCGLYEHADARRTSIPAALAFAEEAGMRGVVVPASILLKNMDMVASASSRRLELMTYGLENNDLDCLRAQADAGVAAAIVDEVAGVTAALGSGEEAADEE